MPQTNLGRVAFKFQGDYSALTTYAKYDVVFDGESSFVSQIDENLGNELIDGLNWKYLAKGNNLGLQDLQQDVTDLETDLNLNIDRLDSEIGLISGTTNYTLTNGIDYNDVNATSGYYNPNTNGAFVENESYTSGNKYVEIKPNTIYSCWWLRSTPQSSTVVIVCWYDSSKNFISGEAYKTKYTSPSSAKYVRLSWQKLTKLMFCEGVEIPTIYSEFGYNEIKIDGEIQRLDKRVDSINETTEYANGDMTSISLNSNKPDMYVNSINDGFNTKKNFESKLIVAINHDDFNLSDIQGTRRIYNKYDFAGSFNFILTPFKNKEEKDTKIKEAKKLIADGNEIGIHAYFSSSFWWLNKMFDLTPSFTATFFSSLQYLQGPNPDKTGVNTFGDTITLSTTFSQIGFIDCTITTPIVNATFVDWLNVMRMYCVYFFNKPVDGIDLDDKIVTKGVLEWAEYWYNNLIDNTLGYSNYTEDMTAKFTEDYEIPSGGTLPSYYPDSAHLMNGKIVFFDDTTNPNYNNVEYQKVGRFKKGLFKGCASCCNYEVSDRIIKISESFCRHYFGIKHFTNYGRHGQQYFDRAYKNGDVIYMNKQLSAVCNEGGKFYSSIEKKFTNGYEILLKNNIRMLNHTGELGAAWTPSVYGQVGLFPNDGARSRYFNTCSNKYGTITFLTLLGNSINSKNDFVSYDVINDIINKHPYLLKYAYENDKAPITGSDGNTYYILSFLRRNINAILASIGTGKIPSLSLDTVADSPNTMVGVALICELCYRLGAKIVPMETARAICDSRDRKLESNYFPNPKFNQSLLKIFGGESTNNDVFLPDGWAFNNDKSDGTYSVGTEVIGGKKQRVFTFVGGSNDQYLQTSVFGLQEGHYKFSTYIKSENSAQWCMFLSKRYNNTKFNSWGETISTCTGSTEYKLYEVEFDVEAPYFTQIEETAVSQICMGYENNLNHIWIMLCAENAKTTKLYSPVLKRIN